MYYQVITMNPELAGMTYVAVDPGESSRTLNFNYNYNYNYNYNFNPVVP